MRGGSYGNDDGELRASCRGFHNPVYESSGVGFRVSEDE
jgi:formylglycine-generating enzyme required for sulfatase activity